MVGNIVLLISKVLASPVYAQRGESRPPEIGDIFGPIENLFGYIFPVGAIIAVGMIIYGGYMWIISGGDPAKKQLAQGTLTWALLGLIFLFIIKAVLTVVLNAIEG
ncbi:MAG: hypothetical protein ACOX0X_01860 [Candidatus Dojkabacteria bacterium]